MAWTNLTTRSSDRPLLTPASHDDGQPDKAQHQAGADQNQGQHREVVRACRRGRRPSVGGRRSQSWRRGATRDYPGSGGSQARSGSRRSPRSNSRRSGRRSRRSRLTGASGGGRSSALSGWRRRPASLSRRGWRSCRSRLRSGQYLKRLAGRCTTGRLALVVVLSGNHDMLTGSNIGNSELQRHLSLSIGHPRGQDRAVTAVEADLDRVGHGRLAAVRLKAPSSDGHDLARLG
jgi:hypothetical protein